MKTIAKALVLSAVVAATAVVPLATAQARDWHHHYDNGDAVALGVLGFATGAIIGGAIASDPGPRYYVDPPVGYYAPPPPPRVVYRTYEPAPVYADGLRPWSGPWYRYCEDRYRSFDPRSGTFIGYDGRAHFCVAN